MTVQLKSSFMTALAVTFATALSGCAEEEVRPPVREQYVIDIARDECGLSDIVKDYYETGASLNGRLYRLDIFRQDRDSMTRTRHRGSDWNLLDYIRRDGRFEFIPNCKSDFSRTMINNNGNRTNIQEEYKFSAGLDRDFLCRTASFRYSGAVGSEFENIVDAGRVQSCINVRTGAKTFDVLHDN